MSDLKLITEVLFRLALVGAMFAGLAYNLKLWLTIGGL
jgi:hypothetical protein